MKKKKPEQPKLDMDLGQASFPPTGLGEGKKGVRTEDLELVKERDLRAEEKKQGGLFQERKGISLSTTHCLNPGKPDEKQ
jgi:hypothetical protein